MKRTICFIATVICLAMNAEAESTSAPLPSEKFEFSITRKGGLKYLLYLPKGYEANKEKRWPLMLFLHGAGERGSDVQRVAIHGPMSLVKGGKDFPFIIVAPQCPDGERWQNDSLLKLLDHAEKKFSVDTNRVYLTGLSMGGYGVWALGVAHPERFAAIAPICGGGQVIDVILAGYGKPVNPVKRLPVWAFHGAKDPTVPLEESERMMGAMKRIDATEAKLTVYPDAEHNSWTETYNNPEFYNWLLKHELPH
jgi:predicted peptidase